MKWIDRAGTVIFCVLLLVLCGCKLNIPQNIPEMKAFEREVKQNYPNVENIKFIWRGSDLSVTLEMRAAAEEEVYKILKLFSATVQEEFFINTFIEDYHSKLIDLTTWDCGLRPGIGLNFSLEGRSQYKFDAGYYLENFISGFDPSGYTLDKYKTWRGTNYITNRAISPEEVEKKLSELP